EMRGRNVLPTHRLEVEDVDRLLWRLDELLRAHRRPRQRIGKLAPRHERFAGESPTRGEQPTPGEDLQECGPARRVFGKRRHGEAGFERGAPVRPTLSAGMDAVAGPSYTSAKSTHNRPGPHGKGSLMATPAEKRATLRKLHAQGCFVIPNPWDVGSARYLQGLGFKALATTSAGFAFTQGIPDGSVPRGMMLAHFREIAAATDVPLNGDFEGGYADGPEGVAESVKLCVETGIAGLSIEDSTSDPATPLYDFDLALARVRAARAAIDQMGGDVVFTARSEGFVRGRPDLEETV